MEILARIVNTEEAHGTVTFLSVPERLFAQALSELEARPDLQALLEPSEDEERLVVAAGGVDWFYGGL